MNVEKICNFFYAIVLVQNKFSMFVQQRRIKCCDLIDFMLIIIVSQHFINILSGKCFLKRVYFSLF